MYTLNDFAQEGGNVVTWPEIFNLLSANFLGILNIDSAPVNIGVSLLYSSR